MDSNFVGFIGIAIGIFLGFIGIAFAIFFGLSGFRKSVTGELSVIKETVIAIRGTAEKTWDLVVTRFGVSSGTIVRELENLGKVSITAEPGAQETTYLIEIEKPVLRHEYLIKISKQTELLQQEMRLFSRESQVIVLSPTRMRWHLPSTDQKTCTEFITLMLKWLTSTYLNSLEEIKKFEEPILT